MLTVLLLDDDPISATHTADDLTAEGLKVIKASPFSAVGAIKSAEKVDVAIKDIIKDKRKVVLSIKLLEEIDRDTALKTYGSDSSGKNLPFSSLSEDLKKKEEDKE